MQEIKIGIAREQKNRLYNHVYSSAANQKKNKISSVAYSHTHF